MLAVMAEAPAGTAVEEEEEEEDAEREEGEEVKIVYADEIVDAVSLSDDEEIRQQRK